ncbi:hypothetical protein D3C86_2142810 [compost metagenome]
MPLFSRLLVGVMVSNLPTEAPSPTSKNGAIHGIGAHMRAFPPIIKAFEDI